MFSGDIGNNPKCQSFPAEGFKWILTSSGYRHWNLDLDLWNTENSCYKFKSSVFYWTFPYFDFYNMTSSLSLLLIECETKWLQQFADIFVLNNKENNWVKNP